MSRDVNIAGVRGTEPARGVWLGAWLVQKAGSQPQVGRNVILVLKRVTGAGETDLVILCGKMMTEVK